MPLRPPIRPSTLRHGPQHVRGQALFHTSTAFQVDHANHYESLGLTPSASPAEIKKRFYALSKSHHPDRNPNDPTAAGRFVKISEAYAVIGNALKRERYDRDLQHSSRPTSASAAASGPAGGRPASGLSRRRTQFRGPPPSFYRSGGWGSQRNKREEAHAKASPSEQPARSEGGMGPASWSVGRDDDVLHWDREGHIRTQEEQDRRRQRRMAGDYVPSTSGAGMMANFVFVGGIISMAILVPSFIGWGLRDKNKEVKTGKTT